MQTLIVYVLRKTFNTDLRLWIFNSTELNKWSDLSSASATLGSGATAQQASAAPKLSNPFMASTAAEKYKPSYMVSQKDFHNTELKPGTTKPISDSSVFSNPFRAKEDRKKAILERHVDMTDKQVG